MSDEHPQCGPNAYGPTHATVAHGSCIASEVRPGWFRYGDDRWGYHRHSSDAIDRATEFGR